MLVGWPELEDAVRGKRFEVVLKNVPVDRKPNIDDDGLQKEIFDRIPQINLLSITGCSMTKLSTYVALGQNLTSLLLAHNSLEKLPDFFGKLTKLKVVDVSHNALCELPESLGALVKLESLILNNNKLTLAAFPALGSLANLHVLHVEHNQLGSLPNSLPSKLSIINAANNCIDELPESVATLSQLRELTLNANKLREIPHVLCKTSRLKVLDLSGNEFADVRFQRLANGKRAKVAAVLSYIERHESQKKRKGDDEAVDEPEDDAQNDVDVAATSITVRINGEQLIVKRHKSVSTLRPFLVCCVLNNVNFHDGDKLKKFIQLQTRLHASPLSEHRVLCAVGSHRMGAFELPLAYMALPPSDLHIRALNKKSTVSGAELLDSLMRDAELARKRVKRSTVDPLHKYLHIVKQDPALACLVDSQQTVISLPPLTNSDTTKLNTESTSVWVEVSSKQSLETCKKAMDEIVGESLKLFPDLSIDQVRVVDEDDVISVYPDKNDLPGVSLSRVSFD